MGFQIFSTGLVCFFIVWVMMETVDDAPRWFKLIGGALVLVGLSSLVIGVAHWSLNNSLYSHSVKGILK